MTSTRTPSGDEQAPVAASPTDAPWPPASTANYTLFVLAVVTAFSIFDRQILSLMIVPIKADFQISDTKAALLLGAAFSLTYGIAGLPIARLADRSNRRNLIAICLAGWSLATAMCGLAQNYVQLFIARLSIGVGEAGFTPAGWSVITDNFPRERVGYANSIVALGGQLGNGLALLLGGASLALVANLPPMNIPFVGVMRSWQWAFIIVGLPGVLWAFMVMTLKEPVRRGVPLSSRPDAPSLWEVLRYMWDDLRTYSAIIGGSCVKYLLALGTTQWMPTLLHREFDWSLSRVGLIQGLVILVVGPLALIWGGKVSVIWARRGVPDTNLRLLLVSLVVSVPLSIAYPLMSNPYVMVALYAINQFTMLVAAGPAIAAAQLVTPNRMRAQVSACSLFTTNVIAFGLGPLIVALFTDYVFSGEQDLKYSMSLCAAILGPLACLLMYQGLKPYARSYARQAH